MNSTISGMRVSRPGRSEFGITATFTKDGINLEKEGLKAPSSTQTFMINDNPRGSVLNRFIKSLKGRLMKMDSDADESGRNTPGP